MSADEYIDADGNKWISPAQVAEIWNERSKLEQRKSNYTRWSVRQRREAMKTLQTPLGYLYLEKDARAIPLRPRSSKRPDVTERNKAQKAKD